MANRPTVNIDYSQVLKYFADIKDPKLASEVLLQGFKAGTLVLRIFMAENLTGRLIGIITSNLRTSAFVDEPKLSRISGGGVVMSMTYGSRGVPYAAIHEFGGQAGRNLSVTLPERRMFRDAGERSLGGIVQQLGIQAIKALKER